MDGAEKEDNDKERRSEKDNRQGRCGLLGKGHKF